MDAGNRIVIDTLAQDMHGHALRWSLGKRGAECSFMFGENFPTRSRISVNVSAAGDSIANYVGPEGSFSLSSSEKLVCWSRRRMGPVLGGEISQDDVAAAMRENRSALDGFRQMLDGWAESIFVNPIAARTNADCKPVQLVAAAASGFSVPRTIFSNNPDEIRAFAEDEGGKVIFKTSTPLAWRQHLENKVVKIMAYSHLVGPADLLDGPAITACSGIFQQPIAKDFEVRITVMGASVFATKINSQENDRTRTDWRVDQRNLRMEAMDVPAPIARNCRAYLARLGLLFGCFDMVVTPDGEWYFLECNEQGQWLWQEFNCPDLHMLDAFTSFIQAPTSGFEYQPVGAPARILDYIAQHWKQDLHQALAENVVRDGVHIRVENAA